MAYKRKESPFYQIRRRRLPGYGDTGILSSGFKHRRTAEAAERVLEELAELALFDQKWTKLLDAVCKHKTVSVTELMQAKRDRRLDALSQNLSDPLVLEVINKQRSRGVDKSHRIGYDILESLITPEHRLSHLDSRVILDLCHRAEGEGRKRNSVRRTLYRAISTLIRQEYGKSRRNQIFDDINFPAENDRRDVHLTTDEVAQLIRSALNLGYVEMALIIRMALQTSADRGVLLGGPKRRGLLVQDLEIWQDHETDTLDGTVFLYDTKDENRSRRIALTHQLCTALIAQCRTRQPHERVFSTLYSQMDYKWRRIRIDAELSHVRFKDLRQQISQYGEEAGVPLTVVQRAMGHSDEAMTRRYQQRQVVWTRDHAEQVEAAMLASYGKAS